jgi:formylglycine-generating enzyme required for sulfatase activity
VKDSTSQAVLEDFARRYGDSIYGTLARSRIEELKRTQVAVVAPPGTPAMPCSDAAAVSLAARAAQPLSRAEECALKPKDVFKECTECPEMVVVPAGRFTMGSPNSEPGRHTDEGPQHVVTLARPFAVGRFHVTVEQFGAFVAETGHDAGSSCFTFEAGKPGARPGRSWRNPGFTQGVAHPVVCLSWDDAEAYVAWLSRKTGKTYRLLTEAEWEYAARGRTEPGAYPRYWFGDSEKDLCRHGNGADLETKSKIASNWTVGTCNDGYAYTAPVGSFLANGFGLFDMAGNAWQWTTDCWNASYDGAPSDGSAWTTGDCTRRVFRGGSWTATPRSLRAAIRSTHTSDGRFQGLGLRLGRSLTP